MANIATIHERIGLLVKAKADNKNTVFAQKLGVSEANIRGYIKGVVPKADVLEKIVSSYDDISAAWLLTGEGSMLKSSPSDIPETPQQSSPEAPSQEKDPKGKRAKQPVSITDTSIVELTKIIAKQAEDLAQQGKQLTQQAREIGRLEEQVRQLTTQKARDAADAPSQDIAHVG